MSSAILEHSTKLNLDSLKKNMPHAILLSGPEGIGLSGAAKHLTHGLSGEVITVLPEKNDTIDIEKGTITVKVIRRLYDTARTKGVMKYIVIDYAERMAQPAQNAFLKLLEEPNEFIHFILLSHQPQLLLPTVQSRTQEVKVRPISKEQSSKMLDDLRVTDEGKRKQLLFMASGLPAELIRLQDEKVFEARSTVVKDARTYITGRPYDRSLLAHKYRDDRPGAISFLDDVLKLLNMTMGIRKDPSLIQSIEKVMHARERVVGNGNIRLQLAVAL